MTDKTPVFKERSFEEPECVMEEKTPYFSFDEYSRNFRRCISLDSDEERLLHKTCS